MQLLEHGDIVDRASVTAKKKALMAVKSDEWKPHMIVFEPLHETALRALDRAWSDRGDGAPLDVLCAKESEMAPPSLEFACRCEMCCQAWPKLS